ncbi:hypothetical protein OO006_12360 [Prosthecochloris sp. SCSIO W1101]|uniref:hypothetical protein n=1 Tax=Prosthecochloris sp. SCSIO W1101 TaxID=2992242 RepID=UPI00223DA31E|nr:hypothetical protein [Prosthecochloris sp. SCSIO W1101]UZJ41123.1 hypothetical protein OO006_12360 [Prosthecochloris sp. SCSIO W1101]
MEITHLLIDDANPAHRELSIYRTGAINRVCLNDSDYRTYGTLEISAHNHTALFHFGIVESLNELPFVSETGHGLDSWDEAFLHHSQLEKMLSILTKAEQKIEPQKKEKALLGWHDTPIAAAYWRTIDPKEFLTFFNKLKTFVSETIEKDYDLEFIL